MIKHDHETILAQAVAGLLNRLSLELKPPPHDVAVAYRVIAITRKAMKDYANSSTSHIISQAMAALGRRSSPAKSAAARKNGKKGGRPKKPPTSIR